MTSTLYAGGQMFDGAEALDGQGILVTDGKIERIAPAGEFEGFSGARVDTTGGTVIPGLMDCHVHLIYKGEPDPATALDKLTDGQATMRALDHAQDNLRGGITSVRDCGGKNYLEFAVRDACNSGRQFGPTISAAGRMICMTGGHGNRMGRVADGCDEVIKGVREQIHAGCDFVKIMATGGVMTPGVDPRDAHYSPEEMKCGVSEAKRFHRRTASHAQGMQGILNAVRAGIDSIEHGIYMDEQCLREMLEAETFLVPTFSALASITENADKGIAAYVIEKTEMVSGRHKESIRMYYEAGGRIAMGTDAGTPFNYHGNNAHELALMVDFAGMTPKDSIITATANAADLIGLDDRGRLKEGLAADLLIVDGDPLSDIAMVADRANHRLVVKNGQPV